MIVIQEDGNFFGETKVLGIGNAKPELKYGKMAKKLREEANLTLEDLSKEFSVKVKQLQDIEEQKKGMTEELISKYMEKFNVEKEYFFDINTARLILGDNGIILKTFDDVNHCKKVFEKLMEDYLNVSSNDTLIIDFRKEM